MQYSPEIKTSIRLKVKNELTNFIYSNLFTTIPLLAVTSSMLVFKLNGHVSKLYLTLWLGAFFLVTAGQGLLAVWFNKTKENQKWEHLYHKLLVADVGLIGILWGVAGVMFMPSDSIGQSYLIFMLTFVAAGGSIYLAGSYLAASVYATGVLIPLVCSLIFSFFSQTHHEVYLNITIGLVACWAFLMVVSYYSSKLFAENFTHSLINQTLSEDLSRANEELERLNALTRAEKEQQLLTAVDNSEDEQNSHNLDRIDALTGADTPDVLDIRFFQSRAYARRHHQSIAVLVVQVNNYKDVLAEHGNEVGNLLLKTVAIRLQYCKRETDILSRIDDNNFVLTISEVLLGTEVMSVINKIKKIFAEKTIINDNKVQINANIGISMYPKDGHELQNLIKNSESALLRLPANNETSHCQVEIFDAGKVSNQINANSTIIQPDYD